MDGDFVLWLLGSILARFILKILKNEKDFFYTLFILILSAQSCSKEGINQNELPNTKPETPTTPKATTLKINVAVTEDRILSFSSIDDFNNALAQITDSEQSHLYDKEIVRWSHSIGFNSLFASYYTAQQEFEQVQSESELHAFMNKYQTQFEISKEKGPKLPVASRSLASLLNDDKFVIIKGNLYWFNQNKQVLVLDGDMDKMQEAISTLKSNKLQGVYVFDYVTSAESRSSCGQTLYGHDFDDTGNKEVEGWQKWWRVIHFTYSNPAWIVDVHFERVVKSWKFRNKWWSKKWIANRDDVIRFGMGWDLRTPCKRIWGGTGWTFTGWKAEIDDFVCQYTTNDLNPFTFFKTSSLYVINLSVDPGTVGSAPYNWGFESGECFFEVACGWD